jgi:ATP-binding protein involved in chromosome partitioning
MSEAYQCACSRIIENMAYFTPEELPENKYYIFGKKERKILLKI